MNVARILRRTVVVAATSLVLGMGMAVAAMPAHAMSRECSYYIGRALYWFDRYVHEPNPAHATVYFAASEAAWDVWYELGCNR
jgi:hypothetical protein